MLHYPYTANYKENVVEMKREQVEVDAILYSFVSIIVLRSGTTLRYDAIYLSESRHVSTRDPWTVGAL